jgi:hypothetical protein
MRETLPNALQHPVFPKKKAAHGDLLPVTF